MSTRQEASDLYVLIMQALGERGWQQFPGLGQAAYVRGGEVVTISNQGHGVLILSSYRYTRPISSGPMNPLTGDLSESPTPVAVFKLDGNPMICDVREVKADQKTRKHWEEHIYQGSSEGAIDELCSRTSQAVRKAILDEGSES